MKFTHLNDLKMDTALEEDAKGGQGLAGYDGYLLPELDRSRFSNKESARMNMEYLKSHWKEV